MKLGRKPALHDRRTLRSGIALARALDPLGTPPAVSADYTTAVLATGSNWGMFLNDQLGDCVCADSAHQVMLRTANAGPTMIVPTDADVLALYEAVGGYDPANPSSDQGCDETTMCRYLMTTGLCGEKLAGTAMIDPTHLDHLCWTVQLFGSCRLGIQVTDAMMDQFKAGQPWTTMAGSVLGGHDVPVVRYDTDGVDVVTWGTLQRVTWPLMGDPTFLEECHAEVAPDFIAATGLSPSGFNLQQLLADLGQIAAS